MSSGVGFRESALFEPLIEWLVARRRVRNDTVLVPEFPWNGRFVDLATLSKSNVTTSYELKMSQTRRALHQSALNSVSFDRNFVVTAACPVQRSLSTAKELGIGVLVINLLTGAVDEVLSAPKRGGIYPAATRRLRAAIASREQGWRDVR